MPDAAETDQRVAIERWFIRQGVPHFITGYSAREDVFTRATPLLGLIFLGELTSAFRFSWHWWQNLLALLGAVAIVLTAYAATNRLRGRRTWQRLDRIGSWEIAAFVIVPPAIPLVLGQKWHQSVALLVTNVVVLGVVYLGTSYAIVPILRRAARQLGRQLTGLANLMAKALPLLLMFSMFIFINADTWGLAEYLPWPFLGLAVGLLALIGSAFVLLRLPKELSGLSSFGSREELQAAAATTPAAGAGTSAGTAESHQPLRRSEKVNLGLLLFSAQAVQVLLAAIVIGVFYLVFGLIVVRGQTVATWTGSHGAPHHLLRLPDLFGHQLVVSRELLVATVFVAAVSGLQFAIAAATDTTYREEFSAETTGNLRPLLAARAIYLSSGPGPAITDRARPGKPARPPG
jgi:hypothetical protein